MSTQKPIENQDPEAAIEQALGHTELFIEKHGKMLVVILVAIVVLVGGYFAYTNLYVAPRSEKASAAMFDAQAQFARDSFAVALNGNGVTLGFNEVIDEFSGTAQANLAQHYAGICCLHMGEFEKAIGYFEQFDPKNEGVGEVLKAQNLGLIGDCYVEMEQTEKGLEYYKKAVQASNNMATAPLFLQKAAMVNLASGNAQAAVEGFQAIKSQFPTSMIARDIDKYIALAQQEQK
ncbi:MAG: tetratricopeptide repeat protein [Mucinivorans sp.]